MGNKELNRYSVGEAEEVSGEDLDAGKTLEGVENIAGVMERW